MGESKEVIVEEYYLRNVSVSHSTLHVVRS